MSEKHLSAPIQFAKIIDEGVGNPLVARLALQTAELLSWLDVSEQKRGDITQLYIFNLCEKIVYCERIVKNLKSLREKSVQETKNNINSAAFIPALEPISHDFLYQSKNFVRDCLLIFDIIYGKRFKEASDLVDLKETGPSKVEQWASKQFGKDHMLTRMLARDAEWVGEPIKKRNAVEHPGGHSGTLQVVNLQRQTVFGGQIIGPFWRRREGPFSSIIVDMEAIIFSMLTFAEELVVAVVQMSPTFDGIEVYEIPEDQRDTASPVRFKVAPKLEILEKIQRMQAEG